MSEVIRQRRADLGMSQGALARAAGVDTRQIRRYEAGEQQPLLSVAIAIADALGISVTELAGRAPSGVSLTGDWWASWQTSRDGAEKIATQPVRMRHEGNLVHIAATAHGLSEADGGYLWTGELRLWDSQVLTGWYAADEGTIRSKGTMYLFIKHAHGIQMLGRWVGLGYDDQVMTGWATMGKTREDSEQAMAELIDERGTAA